MENREILNNIIGDNISDDNIAVVANYIKETNNLVNDKKFDKVTNIEYYSDQGFYIITYDNLYTVTIPISNQTVGETIAGINNGYNVKFEDVLDNTNVSSDLYQDEIILRTSSEINSSSVPSNFNNTISVDFDLLEKITTTYDSTNISLSNLRKYVVNNNLSSLLATYYNSLGIDFSSEIDGIITKINTLIDNIQTSIIVLMSIDEELGRELIDLIFAGDEETKQNLQMYAYSADKEILTFDEYVELLNDSSEYCEEQRANYYEELKNNFAVSLYYLKTSQTPKLLNMIVESVYDAGVEIKVERNGTEYQEGLIEFKNNLGEYILKDYVFEDHIYDENGNVPDIMVWYSCETKYDQALLYLSFQDNPISFFYDGLASDHCPMDDFINEVYPYYDEEYDVIDYDDSLYHPPLYSVWSEESNIGRNFIDGLYESYKRIEYLPECINNHDTSAISGLFDVIDKIGDDISKYFNYNYFDGNKDGLSMVRAAVSLGYYKGDYFDVYNDPNMSEDEKKQIDDYLCSYDFLLDICGNDSEKMAKLMGTYYLYSGQIEGIENYTNPNDRYNYAIKYISDNRIDDIFSMTQCLNETFSIVVEPYNYYSSQISIINNYERSIMNSLAERLDTSDITDEEVAQMRIELGDIEDINHGYTGDYLDDYQIRAYIALKKNNQEEYAKNYREKDLEDLIVAGKGFDEAKTFIQNILTTSKYASYFIPFGFLIEPALMAVGGIENGVTKSIKGVGDLFWADGKKDIFDYKLEFLRQFLKEDYSVYSDYFDEGDEGYIHSLLGNNYEYLTRNYPQISSEDLEKYSDKGYGNYEILYRLGLIEEDDYTKCCSLVNTLKNSPDDISFYASLNKDFLRGADYVLYSGGEGVGNMAISIALSYVGAHFGMPALGMVGKAWMFASAAGEQKESMLQSGYSNDGWTLLYSLMAGATEMVMETKFGAIPGISENANGILSIFDGMNPKLGSFCSSLVKEVWEENGENVISDIFALGVGELENLVGYHGKNTMDLLPQSEEEWFDRAWETTWQTLITTAMLDGANINNLFITEEDERQEFYRNVDYIVPGEENRTNIIKEIINKVKNKKINKIIEDFRNGCDEKIGGFFGDEQVHYSIELSEEEALFLYNKYKENVLVNHDKIQYIIELRKCINIFSNCTDFNGKMSYEDASKINDYIIPSYANNVIPHIKNASFQEIIGFLQNTENLNESLRTQLYQHIIDKNISINELNEMISTIETIQNEVDIECIKKIGLEKYLDNKEIFDNLSDEIKRNYCNGQISDSDIKNNPSLLTILDDDVINKIIKNSELNELTEMLKNNGNVDAAKHIIEKYFNNSGKLNDPMEGMVNYLLLNSDNLNNLNVALEMLENIERINALEITRFSKGTNFWEYLFQQNNPLQYLEQLEKDFSNDSMPDFAKNFVVFLSDYCDYHDYFDDSYKGRGSGHLSPLLKLGDSALREKLVMFSDCFKCTLGSNSSNVVNYLNDLEEGEKIYRKVKDEGISYADLSFEEKQQLDKFASSLDTSYRYSFLGMADENLPQNNDTIQFIDELSKRMGVKNSISDRVIEMYGQFSNIRTIEEVRDYMKTQTEKANERNRNNVNENQFVRTNNGYLIKGIPNDDLDYKVLQSILENGVLPGEFRMANPDENTPFDADVSYKKRLSDELYFGGEYQLIFKVDDRFVVTSNIEQQKDYTKITDEHIMDDNGIIDPRYEVYNTATVQGIRTGIPSTEIDAIMVYGDTYDSNMAYAIATAGFYIPIINRGGKVLFTEEMYDNLRNSMN